MDLLYSFTESVFLVFFALFPILNPPAMAPVFNRLTSHLSQDRQKKVAMLVSKYSFYLLSISAITGIWIMNIFGISVGAIKIAGGLLLLNTAWRMLNNKNSSDKINEEDIKIDEKKAFYPMTLPLTAGPGSISVAISIGPVLKEFSIQAIFKIAGILCGILLASISIYTFYRYSSVLINKLDQSKQNIFSNLSAFILFTIAVQIFFEGIKIIVK